MGWWQTSSAQYWKATNWLLAGFVETVNSQITAKDDFGVVKPTRHPVGLGDKPTRESRSLRGRAHAKFTTWHYKKEERAHAKLQSGADSLSVLSLDWRLEYCVEQQQVG